MDDITYQKHFDRIVKCAEHDTLMEYNKWISIIPYIPFKSSWQVKPIPPFG